MLTSNWLQIYTGLIIDVANPRPEDICAEDIAHALSNLCRYGGHTPRWYSVAAHSVAMANYVFKVRGVQWRGRDVAENLLHDASEAYLGDVISPVRRQYQLMTEEEGSPGCEGARDCMVERLHRKWSEAIWLKFGLDGRYLRCLNNINADQLALQTEVQLLWPERQQPWIEAGLISSDRWPEELIALMTSCVQRAMDLEANGTPEGREAVKTEFLRILNTELAARKNELSTTKETR